MSTNILGQVLADQMGVPHPQTEYHFQQTLLDSPTYRSELCKLAMDLYDQADLTHSFERNLIQLTTKRAAAGDQVAQDVQVQICESLLESLGQTKQAAGAKSIIARVAGGAASLSPGLIKTLLAASAATGAGLGAVGWALNRDTKTDEQEIEQMQAQIDTYDRITNEISNRLQDRGLTPDFEQDVRGIAGTDRVVSRGGL